jgi:hypothetical protein
MGVNMSFGGGPNIEQNEETEKVDLSNKNYPKMKNVFSFGHIIQDKKSNSKKSLLNDSNIKFVESVEISDNKIAQILGNNLKNKEESEPPSGVKLASLILSSLNQVSDRKQPSKI